MKNPVTNTQSNNELSINSEDSYSINNSIDIDGMMDELSSEHSAEIECEFENNIRVEALQGAKNYYNHEIQNRQFISEDIKGVTSNFCNNLIDQYNDAKGSEINEKNSISSMVKTGFLDFHKPSQSTSFHKDELTENTLKMDLNAYQDNGNNVKGNKRVHGINKKFAEKESLNIDIECGNDNDNELLIQSKDNKKKKRHNNNKQHSKQKKQKEKHVLSDLENLIDDSLRK